MRRPTPGVFKSMRQNNTCTLYMYVHVGWHCALSLKMNMLQYSMTKITDCFTLVFQSCYGWWGSLLRTFVCSIDLENLHIIKVQNNNAWCIQTCPNFLLIRIDLITSVVRSHLPTNATFFGRSCSYKLRQSAPCRGLKIASISTYRSVLI